MNKKINLNEKIFLAGANGMAGKAIYRSLKRKGYGDANFGGHIFTPRREQLDLSKISDVKSWFQVHKPTVVIIAAAKVGGILANSKYPTDFLLENLKIQINLIETAWENNVKRLLFLGSSCIYPRDSKQPIKEDYLLKGELEETNEWYAIAKIAGLKLCQSLRIQYGFDAITLMPSNIYGIGDNYHPTNSHVMASLIRKFCNAVKESSASVTCWGSGISLREFMYCDDLGDAVIFALENWDPNSSEAPKNKHGQSLTYLNIGPGKDISIKELTKRIASETGFRGKVKWDNSKPDGTFRKILDSSNMRSLGWKPSISLDTGIKITVEDYKNKFLQ